MDGNCLNDVIKRVRADVLRLADLDQGKDAPSINIAHLLLPEAGLPSKIAACCTILEGVIDEVAQKGYLPKLIFRLNSSPFINIDLPIDLEGQIKFDVVKILLSRKNGSYRFSNDFCYYRHPTKIADFGRYNESVCVYYEAQSHLSKNGIYYDFDRRIVAEYRP